MTKNNIFIDKAKLVHGNRYDYSKVIYTKAKDKLTITCLIHGDFNQEARVHLSGSGCPLCSGNKKLTRDSFIDKANQIHNNRYDYSLVNSDITSRTKVKILCPIHGEFNQVVSSHVNKHYGCPRCAREESGFTRTNFKDKCIKNNNGLGILYVLECFNDQEKFFKIGITSRSIKARYKTKVHMPYAYRVIDEIIGDPEYIYDLEIKMHKQHKDFKHIPSIPFGGHLTECFNTYMGGKNG